MQLFGYVYTYTQNISPKFQNQSPLEFCGKSTHLMASLSVLWAPEANILVLGRNFWDRAVNHDLENPRFLHIPMNKIFDLLPRKQWRKTNL